MAKAPTIVRLIKGKEPLLRRAVCEVRFRDGYLFLDQCGRLLKKLAESSPEWVVPNEATPTGANMFHLTTGCALTFSRQGASLDRNSTGVDEVIEPSDVEQFAKLAEDAFGLIFDELEVKEWSRIGYREQYYFACASKEEVEKWLSELGLLTVSPTLADSFTVRPGAIGLSLVLEGDDCSYRLALNGIERSAQVLMGETTLTVRSSALPENQRNVLKEKLKKQRQRQINVAFAAVLDIDAYRDDPAELDVGNFIRECTSNSLERFAAPFLRRTERKGNDHVRETRPGCRCQRWSANRSFGKDRQPDF